MESKDINSERAKMSLEQIEPVVIIYSHFSLYYTIVYKKVMMYWLYLILFDLVDGEALLYRLLVNGINGNTYFSRTHATRRMVRSAPLAPATIIRDCYRADQFDFAV